MEGGEKAPEVWVTGWRYLATENSLPTIKYAVSARGCGFEEDDNDEFGVGSSKSVLYV